MIVVRRRLALYSPWGLWPGSGDRQMSSSMGIRGMLAKSDAVLFCSVHRFTLLDRQNICEHTTNVRKIMLCLELECVTKCLFDNNKIGV